jgi:hypothetical protein
MKHLFALLLFVFSGSAVGHLQLEKEYQAAWCAGQTEYVLPDRTRIDCLTNDFAIEIDFADHWNQSPGQALFYSNYYNAILGFDKWQVWVRPAIALILEIESDCRFLKRLRTATYIKIFQIGPFANKCN